MTKKFSDLKQGVKVSYMFPLLHREVAKAVSSDIPRIRFIQAETGFKQRYLTNIMGKFKCDNSSCSSHGWGSKKVAIVIRQFPKNGYNATVFNQRCESCKKLGVMTLDEDSYIERVAYRLKKWVGVAIGKPYYDDGQGPPHKSDLCEGCKSGFCKMKNSSY
ncbi:zinc-binding domain-containing protein [Daldinia sp. FL1419]|nr:zinc-binding domain-containing protein [Daldinia sp. FL1419]